MMNIRVWVRRPSKNPTQIRVSNEDLVDHLKYEILLRYSQSLGKYYDSPDLAIAVVPSESNPSKSENPDTHVIRVLNPDENVLNILNTYFPEGQKMQDSLIVLLPSENIASIVNFIKSVPNKPLSHSLSCIDMSRKIDNDNQMTDLSLNSIQHSYASDQYTIHSGSWNQRNNDSEIHNSQRSKTNHHPRHFAQKYELSSLNQFIKTEIEKMNVPNETDFRTITEIREIDDSSNQPMVRMGSQSNLTSFSKSAHQGVSFYENLAQFANEPLPIFPADPGDLDFDIISQEQLGITQYSETVSIEPQYSPVGIRLESTLDDILPPINVLIVEDNFVNQKILEAFMRKRKLIYSIAKNGREAIDKWKAGTYHLVLMDIQLPILSGIEAAKEIRRLERLNHIGVFASEAESPNDNEKLPDTSLKNPVIIVALTASSLQSDRHEALNAGCNDFLTKPVSLEWLEKKVREWGFMQTLIDFEGWTKFRRDKKGGKAEFEL